ncbi:uncharacterized protein FTJAE_14213 [Fusarium tjaetaba]|uniref:RanBP2-type domain-containing protein n=1 Tax=Fusarium tjaetaba TaxID=1567544 RepID=A0A8H5Q9B1_9HYPO|nr:uncharacterized protein FTJAE_14213 [Fusarium tjaetaba]KAF5611250.1 hypothetical protein FTJAE_14213 [Fusarium tjaetaba]
MAEMHNVPPEKSVFWLCNQYKGEGEKCGNLNDIKDKQCDDCKMRRDKGDLACNERIRVIGKLKKVEGEALIAGIREDTEVWKCMRTNPDGTRCPGATDPAQMLCHKCGLKRDVGAVANNEDGKKIGELKKVEATGIEHWEFNDN